VQKTYSLKQDIIIIGAGIVGLATGLQILRKRPGIKLVIVDKESNIASHQTGHNSGVIHSGLYYKPGSLKAVNCLDGYQQLLTYCEENDVPYEICGKVVVATEEKEVPLLNNLLERGIRNGLQGLKRLSKEELLEIEPHVSGVEAILVPQTGIVDYVQVAQSYADNIRSLGGDIHLGEKVSTIIPQNGQSEVITSNNSYQTSLVINCSGLYADKVAAYTHQHINFQIIPFRGEYYELRKEKEYLVKNLIYPVPDPNFPFLGVHFTRMIDGGVEAGPNAVLAWKREGYSRTAFDARELQETLQWPGFRKVARKYWQTGLGEIYRSYSKAAFTRALQKLMPEITAADLVPGEAGVRAQACDREGGLIDDFLILENEVAINVCNAPSPAATSSLAIGGTISQLALKHLD
jgi:(S)-2-hydroxyglutarate dehydrogenase